MTCHSCALVLRNPQRLQCGHSICSCCVSECGLECPECRQKFDKKKISKDILAFNLIEELTVQCNQQDCEWKGRFDDFKTHYRQKHMLAPVNNQKAQSDLVEGNAKPADSTSVSRQMRRTRPLSRSLSPVKESSSRRPATPSNRARPANTPQRPRVQAPCPPPQRPQEVANSQVEPVLTGDLDIESHGPSSSTVGEQISVQAQFQTSNQQQSIWGTAEMLAFTLNIFARIFRE